MNYRTILMNLSMAVAGAVTVSLLGLIWSTVEDGIVVSALGGITKRDILTEEEIKNKVPLREAIRGMTGKTGEQGPKGEKGERGAPGEVGFANFVTREYLLSVPTDQRSNTIELMEGADACFITRISAEMGGVDPLIGIYLDEATSRWYLKGRFYPEKRKEGHDSQVNVRCFKFELAKAPSETGQRQ